MLALVLLVTGTHALSARETAPQSYTEAMEWYRNGAEAGDAKAQFFLGLALEEGAQGRQDLAAAREMFERAAKSGHALALFKLALMSQSGRGGPTDQVAARRLYRLAAEQGVVEAKYNLAVMRQDGVGGAVDPMGAAEMFEAAARDGVKISFLHLAVLSTADAAPNLVEALKWALLANAAKVEGAAQVIDTLAGTLSSEQRAEAEARARDWK